MIPTGVDQGSPGTYYSSPSPNRSASIPVSPFSLIMPCTASQCEWPCTPPSPISLLGFVVVRDQGATIQGYLGNTITVEDVKDSVESAGARARRELQIGVPPTGFMLKQKVVAALKRAPEHRPDEETPEEKAQRADILVRALAVDFFASDEGQNLSMCEVVFFNEAQAMGTDNKDPAGLGGSDICIARVYPLDNGESAWFVGTVIEHAQRAYN